MIRAALAIACAFAAGLNAPLQVTYELQHVDANGALYVLDYDLSRDDCRAALETLPAGYAACAAVPS